jgi:hypothetical protein
MGNRIFKCFAAGFALVWMAPSVSAQTTAFTYQGRLTDGGNPANGNYDLQFKLFDTPTVGTGTQQGTPITTPTVQVTNGSFTVMLDFGASVFDGTARYLEIGVRPTGSLNPYTVLAPRTQITSSPYAIQTINTQQLGGLPASRYVAADAGGNVGIGTSSPASKLDVRGNLTLDAGTSPVLYASTAGTEQNRYLQLINSPPFASASGLKAGGVLVADSYGYANPGKNDLIVKGNVGIGTASPQSILSVQTGSLSYGLTHTNGTVTVGSYVDSTGGWLGTRSNHPLHFFVNDSTPQMTVAGNIWGKANVGIGNGTDNPSALLHVKGEIPTLRLEATRPEFGPTIDLWATFGKWSIFAPGPTSGDSGNLLFYNGLDGFTRLVITRGGNVGIGTNGPFRMLHVNGRARIASIPLEASSAPICFNTDGDLLQCGASSLKWKTNIHPFRSGLDVVMRLRPIHFTWKESGLADFGLGAEEVVQVAPELTFADAQGEVKGVKYDRLSVLFINAFKEQQTLIKRQQRQLEALIKVICQLQPQAAICQKAKP